MCLCMVYICLYVCSCLMCLCVGVTVGFNYKEDRYPCQSALLQIETFKHSYKIYVIKHSTHNCSLYGVSSTSINLSTTSLSSRLN